MKTVNICTKIKEKLHKNYAKKIRNGESIKKTGMVLGGILIAGISMSILTGCSGDPEKDIVGTWYFDCESVSDEFGYGAFGDAESISCMSDGSFITEREREHETIGVYSFADDRISITTQKISGIRSTNVYMYTYKISGKTMTLDNDEEVLELSKK